MGELLHPAAREYAAHRAGHRIELGSSAFAAQYQQQPVAEDDGLVRRAWFGRYKNLPARRTPRAKLGYRHSNRGAA